MSVLLLSDDLLVLSRVEAAAARMGIGIQSAASSVQAAQCSGGKPPKLIIVDLAAARLDLAALVREIKGGGSMTKVLAFGPHVHQARLDAARDAGCDEVVSRGQFFAQLDTILSRFAAE
jgi:DNA-binding NarL/FixJ family response regulator